MQNLTSIKYPLLLLLFSLSISPTMAQDSIRIKAKSLLLGNREPDMFLKTPYEVVNGKVYFVWIGDIGSSRPMTRKFHDPTELNANHFIIISDIYAKDSTMVYYKAKKIPDADAQSFEVMEWLYSKDARNVYYGDSIILHADPQTFQLIENNNRNKDKYLSELHIYSKDKNHVYLDAKVIEYADPEAIELLAYPYAKDKKHVYRFRETMDADVKSFKIVAVDIFSKDSINAFYMNEKIVGADPITFTFISNAYSKDAKHVFYKTKMIAKANPGTFSYSGPYSYAKDDYHIFYNNILVEGIDIKSASYAMYDDYIKDKYSVFYKGKKIEGVDISAFKVDFHEGATFVYDTQYIYYEGQQEEIDLESFSTQANVRPPMDKGYIYLLEKNGLHRVENNKKNRKKYNINYPDGCNELLRIENRGLPLWGKWE